MRDGNVFAHTRALPRMSWSPHNLFNLWTRSLGPKVSQSTFDRTPAPLFKQRWISKRLMRAYHGDHIPEKTFKRWYLPATLPDVRPRKSSIGDDSASLAKWAKRDDISEQMSHTQESLDRTALAPVGSLMFREVERRIDVFIFRCCFAHSVYEARRLVIHGNVKLNGKEHTNANTRLAPGDMVSVDPAAIRFLRQSPKVTEAIENDHEEDDTEESEDEDVEKNEETVEDSEDKDAEQKTSEDKDAEQKASEDKEAERKARAEAWAKRKNKGLTPFHLPDYAAPFIFIPAYIEPSFLTCSAIYVRHPTARPGYSEIPTPYDADGEVVRLTWEWYAKRRPRMRSRSQLASMPDDNERKRAR